MKFVGNIKGKAVTEHTVKTPGAATALKLTIDESGKSLKADNNDFVFIYASVVDANGTVVPTAKQTLSFSCEGGEIIGSGKIKAEAGINGILLRSKNNAQKITITVKSAGLTSAQTTIKTKP